MFARVLQFYGIDYDRLLKTPVRRFWFLNRQIDRIQAEKELRQVQVVGSTTNQETWKNTVEGLQRTMGEIVVYEPSSPVLDIASDGRDPDFDREGFERLRAMAQGNRRK